MAIPSKKILIPLDYIKKITPINSPVDDSIMNSSAYVAQDKWVRPYLGDALYNKIVTDTAAGTITGNYLILRDTYMADAIAWWCYYEALPHCTYKIDNGTINQRVSDDTQPIDNSTLNRLLDSGRNNAEYYTKRLSEWICANSDLFPELSTNTEEQRSPISQTATVPAVSFSTGNSESSRTGYIPDRNLLRKLPL